MWARTCRRGSRTGTCRQGLGDGNLGKCARDVWTGTCGRGLVDADVWTGTCGRGHGDGDVGTVACKTGAIFFVLSKERRRVRGKRGVRVTRDGLDASSALAFACKTQNNKDCSAGYVDGDVGTEAWGQGREVREVGARQGTGTYYVKTSMFGRRDVNEFACGMWNEGQLNGSKLKVTWLLKIKGSLDFNSVFPCFCFRRKIAVK